MRKIADRKNALKVLEALADGDELSVAKLAKIVGLPRRTVDNQISYLISERLAHCAGKVEVNKGAIKTVTLYAVGASPAERAKAATQAKRVKRRPLPEPIRADDTVLNQILARAREIHALAGNNHWACQIASMEVRA